MNLYELTIEGLEIERLLEESAGELSVDLEARFDALLRGGKEKINAALCVRRNLLADAEQCRAEAQRLWERQMSIEGNVAQLEARILNAIDGAFDGKVKTALFTAYGQTSPGGVNVEMAPDADIHKLPAELVKITPPELRKQAIKDYLKANGEGCLPEVVVTPYDGKRSLRVK